MYINEHSTNVYREVKANVWPVYLVLTAAKCFIRYLIQKYTINILIDIDLSTLFIYMNVIQRKF